MNRSRIVAAARERMRTDGGTYYDDSEPPELEMLDATHFVAHRYVYNSAWSGSDWADDYILLGRIVDGHIELEPFYVHLTELQSDDYDKQQVLDLLRKNDRDGARAAIERMKGVTEDKVRVHCAKIEAASAPATPAPTARCPECQSTDAGVVEVVFENIKMRCNACRFEQWIDSWDRETWDP